MTRRAGLLVAAGFVFVVACGTSDSAITTAVKTKMAADPIVKAYDLHVKTKEGVVTLSGDVDTSVAHEQVVKITRDTKGVQDIVDHVHVRDTEATSGYLDRTAPQQRR